MEDEDENEEIKLDLFKDILPSIWQTKEDVFEKYGIGYNKFPTYAVNKALSLHRDSLMQANNMNLHRFLDKKMQYDYYIYSLRAYKRPFQQWPKKQSPEDIKEIAEYFKFSMEKASAALKLLSQDDIDMIKTKNNKGGILHDKPRRPSGNNTA